MRKAACQHYWRIEDCHGPVSVGVCVKCGQKKQFQNYLDLAPDKVHRLYQNEMAVK